MSGLTPRDRERLQVLDTFVNRIHHVRSLVEQLAAERGNPEPLSLQLRRAFNQLKLQLTSAGFDTMANACGMMEVTARRGMAAPAKARMLRDGVGNLVRFLEQEKRQIQTAAKRAADSGAQE